MEALKLRAQLKAKKPTFVRQEGRNLGKLGVVWRAPKGMHSKLRKKLRGHIKQPSIGYSSPKVVRGLSPSGLNPVLISYETELEKIQENDGIILSRTLGDRKKIIILKKIKEQNLKTLNVKDVGAAIKLIEDNIKSRKDKKTALKKKKEESKKKAEKKPEVKEKKEEKVETSEEKEKREKEAKRKVLENKNER